MPRTTGRQPSWATFGSSPLAEASAGENAYAFVSGFGIARDTTASISDWGEGADDVAAAASVELEGFEVGGGGGVAAVRVALFFPRPSKISRSDPLLLSSDIRVS